MAKADTQGIIAAINEFVRLDLTGDYDTGTVQVIGTYTGALTVQASLNGTNWITLGGATALTNIATANPAANIASATQGIFQFDVSGFAAVRVIALGAVTGAATVILAAGMGSGIVGIDTPVTLAAGTAAIGTLATPAGSALSVVSTASTNAANHKSTAGNLFEISVSNPTATAAYVKLYNKATAPTVGTDVPVMTIVAPATSATQTQSQVNLTFSQIGKRFPLGIGMAITAGPLATDTAAAVAGVQVHATYI